MRKSYSLLNCEIPSLADYSGLNNPFLYDVEVEALTAKHKARLQHVNTFTSGLPGLPDDYTQKDKQVENGHSNGLNGLRRRESLNGFGNHMPANSLERCIYEGDALEWDEFQVRAMRTEPQAGIAALYTEYYDDMPELKMKLY